MRVKAVLTPDGRFANAMLAAAHHGISYALASHWARMSRHGWRYENSQPSLWPAVPATTPAFHQKHSKGVLNRRDRLATAVLLFHRDSSEWTSEDHAAWREATGEDDVTARVLCDLAQRILYRTHNS
jgi:hypothetical protein